MSSLKAVVHKGRLVLDEPTQLPEGTVVELQAVDADYEMDEAELAKLDASLARSVEDEKAGRMRSTREVMDKLRACR